MHCRDSRVNSVNADCELLGNLKVKGLCVPIPGCSPHIRACRLHMQIYIIHVLFAPGSSCYKKSLHKRTLQLNFNICGHLRSTYT